MKLPPDNTDPTWSTGGTTNTIIVTNSGFYSVLATDAQGCITSGEIYLEAIDCELIIPNVFTPNGDGVNDHWAPHGGLIGCIAKIYDRWGDVIYEGDIMQKPWNGKTVSGMACSDGVYYFEIEVHRANGSNSMHTGYIQLRH